MGGRGAITVSTSGVAWGSGLVRLGVAQGDGRVSQDVPLDLPEDQAGASLAVRAAEGVKRVRRGVGRGPDPGLILRRGLPHPDANAPLAAEQASM